jgi:hypothetical protein
MNFTYIAAQCNKSTNMHGNTLLLSETCLNHILVHISGGLKQANLEFSSRQIWWKLHNGNWASHAVGNVVADASHK